MTNTHNVMAPKGPSWSPLKNSALKSVRNIFSAVHKPKCVHEYIIKIALTKTTMTLLRVISKRTQYPLNMTTTPGKCNNIIIMYKLRKFSFQTIKYLSKFKKL